MKRKYLIEYPLKAKLLIKVEAEDEFEAEKFGKEKADIKLLEIETDHPQLDLLDYDPMESSDLREL